MKWRDTRCIRNPFSCSKLSIIIIEWCSLSFSGCFPCLIRGVVVTTVDIHWIDYYCMPEFDTFPKRWQHIDNNNNGIFQICTYFVVCETQFGCLLFCPFKYLSFQCLWDTSTILFHMYVYIIPIRLCIIDNVKEFIISIRIRHILDERISVLVVSHSSRPQMYRLVESKCNNNRNSLSD